MKRWPKTSVSLPEVGQVTLVLEPSASGADLVCRALATDPEEAAKALELERSGRRSKLLSGEVRGERSEEFKAGGRRRDGEDGGGDGLGERVGEVRGVAWGDMSDQIRGDASDA